MSRVVDHREDPFLPYLACPASNDEWYVVRGVRIGPFVEVSLSRGRYEQPNSPSAAYVPIEELAVKRFPHLHTSEYVEYAGRLEDAAKYAARGELGYVVSMLADATGLNVCIVERTLDNDGRLDTAISHQHHFEDPDSHAALVQASETAAELREVARQLNYEWASSRRAHLLEVRSEYEKADELAEAAERLRRIVDSDNG